MELRKFHQTGDSAQMEQGLHTDNGGKPRATPSTSAAMQREFRTRSVAIILAILTLTTGIFAWINFVKEQEFAVPFDGVWWMEQGGHLQAERLDPNGPGARAGIEPGDILLQIDGRPITNNASHIRQTFKIGVYSKAAYSLSRQGLRLEMPVILVPADHSINSGLRLIALIYLGIGLYVLFRRWTAPRSTHFFIFCLVSFVLYSFKYTGKLNLFDWCIYWGNVAAQLLQPALFLHFALTFPEDQRAAGKPFRSRIWLVYVPAALLLMAQVYAIRMLAATETLRFRLDQVAMLYLVVYFALAAAVLVKSYLQAKDALLRQQMKWVTRGTILAIVPFTFFYVIPFLMGQYVPTTAMKISGLSLVFLPLTFAYAIVRYRLMDVDLIFKRGVTYTLSTALIAALYFGAVALSAEVVHNRLPSFGSWGLLASIMATAILFEPLKNWIQARVDRFFYRKRYDYRRTLIDFGRELSSETDLKALLASVVDRLSRTLMVDRVAIFTARQGGGFVLANCAGFTAPPALDLGFLHFSNQSSPHLFFDNTRQVLHETPSARDALARLDLNYYVPCTIQDRTIAVIGLGRTHDGDFLSSEDVELLASLAGYIGIAIQNAHLYASLEQKIVQYERLKDFNENIVESISVGVLAVDLEDRVDSWNSQMEVMYATPRSQALRRPLSDILPPAFLEEYYRVRQTPGIHNLYKFRMATPAGETRIANIAIAPLVTREFQVVGRLIIVDDITERIELETHLSQAEKMSSIGLLAAGVAHEVNTPLAVISTYAQMLSKQLQDDPKLSPLLDKITRQSFRASEIVNGLLNFSRTSATEFGEVNVNQVIEETLALLQHQFKTTRIAVQSQIDPDLPSVAGNSGKLQQVFLNLFLNAKDAMPGGGNLTITTRHAAGVEVWITDSGTGISPEHIHRIYEPFFTTKNSYREGQGRGTGLGLAVTYGIIQEHAGKIHVDSNPGQGTTFHLDFPTLRKAVHA